jgi:uncharacterized repeat protein (TIGR03803 family)
MSRIDTWVRVFASLGLAAAIALPSAATAGKKIAVLHSFNGSDGMWPYAGVTQDKDGTLYGTTLLGGTGCGGPGCGTVYKIAPDGTQTVIYMFKDDLDGREPRSGALVLDKKGNLFGTTLHGGSRGCANGLGCGSIFKIAPDGSKKTLYAFKGMVDGLYPYSGVVADKDGNLYGATAGGGDMSCGPVAGCGVVFKYSRKGEFSVLHAFTAGADGSFPNGSVSVDAAGNVYGTTNTGGTGTCDGPTPGCGTVFKITPDGTTQILYNFQGGSDGAGPMAEVVLGPDGALYGTAAGGGDAQCGCGTVFRLALDGGFTILHQFTGIDGKRPYAPLTFDRFGNLYGTTNGGGSKCGTEGCGTIFKIDTSGVFTSLYSLTGKADGHYFDGAVHVDRKGTVYATGVWGGDRSSCMNGCGTVLMLKAK